MATNNANNKQSDTITINPTGTGAGNTGEIRFLELAANGSNYVSIKSPDNLPGNFTYSFPAAYPTVDGQVLSSTTAGAMSWSTAGTSSFDLISTATASNSATIVFTGLSSTYTSYYIVISSLMFSAATTMTMRFSTNAGASYDTGTNYQNSYIRYDSTPTATAGGANAQTSALLTDPYTASNGTGALQNFAVRLTGVGLTNQRVIYLSEMVMDNGTRQVCNDYRGFYNTTATGTVVTAVQFAPGTGNFQSGTFKLYGLK